MSQFLVIENCPEICVNLQFNPGWNLWSSSKNLVYLLKPEILKGTSMFVRHESTLLSLEKYATTGLDGEIFPGKTEIKCYPNPFNDEITIEIMLHKEEEIQLDIFNQLGQRIKTLSNKQPLPAGSFRFIWNGRNHSNQKVTSGIYYVKFSTDEVQKFQKIFSCFVQWDTVIMS